MTPLWNINFSVGHDHIDEHHKELFQLTFLLDKAIQSCRATQLEEVLIFLETYVADHFLEEETLMLDKNFKHYQDHKNEHTYFSNWVSQLRNRFDEGKSRTHLIFELRQLIDRLIRHIRTTDVLLSELERGNT